MLLKKESQLELLWWVKNIEIYYGKTLIQVPAQALLQTDASITGWGGSLGRSENWRDDSAGEKDAHKRAGTSCIKTSPGNLFKAQEIKSLDIQMDNIVALTYFLKMGGTKNL